MRLLLTVLGVIFSATLTCQIQNVWKLDNFRANSPLEMEFIMKYGDLSKTAKNTPLLERCMEPFFFRITEEINWNQVAYEDGALFILYCYT